MSKLKIYRASAGAGKTYTLTKEYLYLLFADPQNFKHTLAVTFTNKACGEMKERIVRQLYVLAHSNESPYISEIASDFSLTKKEVQQKAAKALASILHNYSYFFIETIDSFFQRVTRSFAKELGIRSMLHTELNSMEVLSKSIDQMFLNIDKDKQLKKWLIDFSAHRISEGKSKNIKQDLESIGRNIFSEQFQILGNEYIDIIADKAKLKEYFAQLKQIQNTLEKEMRQIGEQGLELMAQYELTVDDFLYKKSGVAYHFENLTKDIYKYGARVMAALDDPSKWTTAKSPNKNMIDAAVHAGLQELLNLSYQKKHESIPIIETVKLLHKHAFTLGVLSDVIVAVREYCEEQNLFLLAYNNMLLNRIIDNNDTPFIYEKTGSFFRNFMIDEFQDTSSLQWHNFKPLLSDSIAQGNLSMVVGDVKQSIYRWRNGDWKLLAEELPSAFNDSHSLYTLENNWRSCENIIDFNNSFFSAALTLLKDDIQNVLQAEEVEMSEDSPLQMLTLAYDDICQKKPEHVKKGGSVSIEFLQLETSAEFKDAALERIPSMIEHLQDNGVDATDIVFLVAKNSECTDIVNYLLDYKKKFGKPGYCYDVISNEALKLGASAAINFIVAYLRLVINPKDSIVSYYLNYELLRRFQSKHNATTTFETFNQSLQRNEYSRLSLYELTESLIDDFQLAHHDADIPYLHVFQDIVNEFSVRNNSSIRAFLEWWDETGYNKTITISDSQNAMRVMTIHKSKGLEFNTVIIPFCNYEFRKNNRGGKTKLWCSTDLKPFSNIPVFPVDYAENMKASIFADYYWKEYVQQYVDQINLLYVALTRAVKNLVVQCPYIAPKKDQNTINHFGQLIHRCVQFNSQNYSTPNEIDRIGFSEYWDAASMSFLFGEITGKNDQKRKIEPLQVNYPVYNYMSRLSVATPKADFFNDFEVGRTRRNFGVAVHGLLENVRTVKDFDGALHKMYLNGEVQLEEKRLLGDMFNNLLEDEKVKSWFHPDNTVLTEHSIMLPGGKTKRPDRVIINTDGVSIIDYKTTFSEQTEHRQQVEEYKNIFIEMGYENVSGYVWYILNNKVIEI